MKRTFEDEEPHVEEEPRQKKKHKKHKQDKQPIAIVETVLPSPEDEQNDRDAYPYPVDADDHCETPLEAYADILPLLSAQANGGVLGALQVYDPYFCEGSMIQRLGSLGITQVYNRKEDFYAKIASQSTPTYDVLVTNPPYSQDHMQRLVQFARESQRPFVLLLPNYVYMKDYMVEWVKGMFFIVPNSRYLYTTPKGRRQQKSSKFTSPFPSFWYCGNFSKPVMEAMAKKLSNKCTLARNSSAIPLAMAPDQDPRKKKQRNSDKRKKHKDRKKLAGGGGGTGGK